MEPTEAKDTTVFITSREATCDECLEALGASAWIVLSPDKRALCLTCADFDHLVFLPAGDTALTRRARKASHVSAVVLKWTRRKRYERQGVLVEEGALEVAELECLADADARARQRERAAVRRQENESEYVRAFAEHVRVMFPALPAEREREISQHACALHSRRVGRTLDAKSFVESAIRSAVVAHIRHRETEYDRLLNSGMSRSLARDAVRADVERTLDAWKG